MKKLDVNECTLAHFTLILSLHYVVKGRSRSLAIHHNEFILGAHASTQKITETTKSLKTCYIFNTSCVYFNIVCRQTKMMHQQWGSCSELLKHAVGELR